MIIASDLGGIYTKLNGVLTDCSAALVEKGQTPAEDLSGIAGKIAAIESGSEIHVCACTASAISSDSLVVTGFDRDTSDFTLAGLFLIINGSVPDFTQNTLTGLTYIARNGVSYGYQLDCMIDSSAYGQSQTTMYDFLEGKISIPDRDRIVISPVGGVRYDPSVAYVGYALLGGSK